jgi:hypothetical protein
LSCATAACACYAGEGCRPAGFACCALGELDASSRCLLCLDRVADEPWVLPAAHDGLLAAVLLPTQWPAAPDRHVVLTSHGCEPGHATRMAVCRLKVVDRCVEAGCKHAAARARSLSPCQVLVDGKCGSVSLHCGGFHAETQHHPLTAPGACCAASIRPQRGVWCQEHVLSECCICAPPRPPAAGHLWQLAGWFANRLLVGCVWSTAQQRMRRLHTVQLAECCVCARSYACVQDPASRQACVF